uniref:Uncharacterized protein n=1 Tax=Macrostomum lignano TaxID=282301 RepID=A0A1I8JEF8_9PLAT
MTSSPTASPFDWPPRRTALPSRHWPILFDAKIFDCQIIGGIFLLLPLLPPPRSLPALQIQIMPPHLQHLCRHQAVQRLSDNQQQLQSANSDLICPCQFQCRCQFSISRRRNRSLPSMAAKRPLPTLCPGIPVRPRGMSKTHPVVIAIDCLLPTLRRNYKS